MSEREFFRQQPDQQGQPDSAAQLKIETHHDGDRVLVVACGELDIGTEYAFYSALREALARAASGIDLDLSGIDFCDCSGLNVLLRVRRQAWAHGQTLVIKGMSPGVERLLTMTGALRIFCPVEALDSFQERGAATAGAEELLTEVVQLRRAMQTRPVVDLARGVLMATFGVSPEDAWTVLVTVSQRSNTKLSLVAQALVDTIGGDPLPDPLRRRVAAAVAPFSTTPAPPEQPADAVGPPGDHPG